MKRLRINLRERDKGKNRRRKLEKFLYQSRVGKKSISKNAYVSIGITCPIVHGITRLTNKNHQTMLALLRKLIKLKKY